MSRLRWSVPAQATKQQRRQRSPGETGQVPARDMRCQKPHTSPGDPVATTSLPCPPRARPARTVRPRARTARGVSIRLVGAGGGRVVWPRPLMVAICGPVHDPGPALRSRLRRPTLCTVGGPTNRILTSSEGAGDLERMVRLSWLSTGSRSPGG